MSAGPPNSGLVPPPPMPGTVVVGRPPAQLKQQQQHPSLSVARMLALNAVVCGLEFCVSAAFCYIPPLLLKAGIAEQNMTLVLAIGPALGFFLVPVIGRASDRCRSRFGRRRPYIFALSAALVASLFIVAFGDSLGRAVLGRGTLGRVAGTALLVIGAAMLDFSCQTCLTPCEALLSDASHGTGQHDRAFTVYSLAVSAGGCVGYLITALDWRGSSVGEYFGTQERSVFMLLAALYSLSALVTFGSIHEVPLGGGVEGVEPPVDAESGGVDAAIPVDPGYVSDDVASSDELFATDVNKLSPRRRRYPSPNPSGSAAAELCRFRQLTLALIERLTRAALSRLRGAVPEVVRSLGSVPLVLRRLAFANFFSWTAIMAFNLFYTDYVGQAVYGGDPGAEEGSDAREQYDRGVRSGSWGLLFHCLASAGYAPAVERLAARFGLRATYYAGMLSFSAAMALMLLARGAWAVNALAACTGFAYATLTTVPFMLVTSYHSDKEVYFHDTTVGSTVPPRGFGADLATLDSAYFLSQVILTVFMGSIVHYSGSVGAYIVCAGAAGCAACVCVQRVVCDKAQMQALRKAEY